MVELADVMGACDEKVEYTLLNPLGYFTYQAEYQVVLDTRCLLP